MTGCSHMALTGIATDNPIASSCFFWFMVVYLQLLSSWLTQCQLPENRCVSLKYVFYGGIAWRLRYIVLMTVWFWLEILCCISSGAINVTRQSSIFSKLGFGSMQENTQNMLWHRKIRFLRYKDATFLYSWFSLGPRTEWSHTLRVIKTMRTKLTWFWRPTHSRPTVMEDMRNLM